MRILSALLTIAGAALLAGGIYLLQPFAPDLDLHRAGSPLIELPVTDRPAHRVLKLRIPDDRMWRTLEKELGQPQFFVGGVGSRNMLLCAKALDLTVIVSSGGRRIPVRKVGDVAYGYSSECEEVGFEFGARAGQQVDIEVTTLGFEEPGASSLVVLPVWQRSLKDVGVGVDIEREFSWLFKTIAAIGAAMLASGIIIIILRRKRGKRSIASF